uniref:Cystinosin n=1 Tax=Clastoptera arizonana TaxID=38151 RepID=A0A1B6CPI3_9HEMI
MNLIPLSNILFVLLVGFNLTRGQFITPQSSVTILLGEIFKTNISLEYSLKNCSQVSFYAELDYITSVQKTGTYSYGNQLLCEIEILGKDLGRTTIWGQINDPSNNKSTSEAIIHVTVEQSYVLGWLSSVCGWTYFSVWVLALYPQIYDNWKRQSVIGFSFDFVTLNLVGYACYSIYNIGFYYVPSIVGDYYKRHPGATNPVQLNDVIFSIHGFFGTAYMVLQVFMYERGGQTMSKAGVILLSTLIIALGLILASALLHIIAWLDSLYYCSYIKLVVTVTKYIPQAFLNYTLKSTIGWSIGAVLCDTCGSVLSVLQMIVISYNRNDWVSIMGDPTKFGLGVLSLCFCVIFLNQHYVLYRHNK